MQKFTLYRADSSEKLKSTVSLISADINGIDDFHSGSRLRQVQWHPAERDNPQLFGLTDSSCMLLVTTHPVKK